MKKLLITIVAVVLVGCGDSQQSTSPEAKPIERVEGAKARVITIHNAVMMKQIAAVKQHIAAGTDVNAKLRGGHTPLHIAVEHTNPSYLEDMMAMDEDADGISNLAEMLLGTDDNDPNSKPTNEEALKAENDWVDVKTNKELRKEITELLIANGANVNAKRDDGETPLHQAADNGHKEVVELLIAKGADVSAKTDNRVTPLHSAADGGQKEIVELLIAKGADVNAKRDDGETPLHQAASKGRKEIIELLITKGADVNAKSDDGWTPLHVAASSEGHKEIVELLIDKGSDVSAKSDRGWTPLHYAAEGHREIAELLIDKGADVNAMSNIGKTPLYLAADSGYKEIIELLIAKGADVNAKTNDEKTLLDMANNPNKRNKNKKFIAELLRKHGAKTAEELKAEGK